MPRRSAAAASPTEIALDLVDANEISGRRSSQPTGDEALIQFVGDMPTDLSRHRIRNENLDVELAISGWAIAAPHPWCYFSDTSEEGACTRRRR